MKSGRVVTAGQDDQQRCADAAMACRFAIQNEMRPGRRWANGPLNRAIKAEEAARGPYDRDVATSRATTCAPTSSSAAERPSRGDNDTIGPRCTSRGGSPERHPRFCVEELKVLDTNPVRGVKRPRAMVATDDCQMLRLGCLFDHWSTAGTGRRTYSSESYFRRCAGPGELAGHAKGGCVMTRRRSICRVRRTRTPECNRRPPTIGMLLWHLTNSPRTARVCSARQSVRERAGARTTTACPGIRLWRPAGSRGVVPHLSR